MVQIVLLIQPANLIFVVDQFVKEPMGLLVRHRHNVSLATVKIMFAGEREFQGALVHLVMIAIISLVLLIKTALVQELLNLVNLVLLVHSAGILLAIIVFVILINLVLEPIKHVIPSLVLMVPAKKQLLLLSSNK